MLHTCSINTLTCIATRFDTQGFVDISSVLDHVIKSNPYVSGLFCTCGAIVIRCVFDISWHLSPNNWQKMSRSSPIRTRYGVSLWIHSMNKVSYFFLSYCVQHRVIFDHDISRCLPWYYCPQITGPPLNVRYGDGQLFRATIHWAVGRLPAGSRGVSKPRDLMLCWSYRSEVNRHSDSTAEVPVKFQSDWRNLNPSLAASRPRGGGESVRI